MQIRDQLEADLHDYFNAMTGHEHSEIRIRVLISHACKGHWNSYDVASITLLSANLTDNNLEVQYETYSAYLFSLLPEFKDWNEISIFTVVSSAYHVCYWCSLEIAPCFFNR